MLRRATLLRISAIIYRATKLFGLSTEICPASVYMIAKPGGYSIEKARRLLGYSPRVSLEEGLRLTEAWLRANGYLAAGSGREPPDQERKAVRAIRL